MRDHILFEDNHVFNPNNATFETPNGDGIDVDSSTHALVRNYIVDAKTPDLRILVLTVLLFFATPGSTKI